MIGVRVNRPVCEERVRTLGADNFAELFIMGRVDDGVRVALTCEHRTSFQNLASAFRLGDARIYGGAGSRLRAGLLAPIEVQQNDVMAHVREARNRSATAVLGVAWMPARNDKLLPRGLPGGCRGGGGESAQNQSPSCKAGHDVSMILASNRSAARASRAPISTHRSMFSRRQKTASLTSPKSSEGVMMVSSSSL